MKTTRPRDLILPCALTLAFAFNFTPQVEVGHNEEAPHSESGCPCAPGAASLRNPQRENPDPEDGGTEEETQ